MPGKPSLVAHLFWTAVLGGGLAWVWGGRGLAAAATGLALVLLHHLDRPRRFRAAVARICRAHADTLALRRHQESYVDAYGNLVEDGWLRERDYFLDRTVIPAVEGRYPDLVEGGIETMRALVEAAADRGAMPDPDVPPVDGIGYERFCEGRLARAGWRTHATPASGDQGADIVADRDGFRLVVQCKRLSKPVGNAAVQEAAAARRYWSAHAAAVVSNAGFTPAARRLAAATEVSLLHHDDLDGFDPDGTDRQNPARIPAKTARPVPG